jgi:Fe-S cluster biogenesis protein NfuA/nitrite reductase/ring-hydroxylating ferredoxin subunit
MAISEASAFRERVQRIEHLIQQVQATANPALRASAEELIQVLLELHGAGLERMLDTIWETGEGGERIIQEQLPADELVSSLLLLHDLHPWPVEDRVQGALDKVRPYLQSHGGNVEIVGIQDGVVRLRLKGSCESCPASSMTLKYAVEDAIFEAAPDVVEVVAVSDERPTAGFISLEQIAADMSAAPAEQSHWHEIDNLGTLTPRKLHAQQVNGQSLIFCRLGENLYAYGNTCPDCQRTLEMARLEGTALACAHCGNSFDVIRAGRGLDKPGLNLEPFPLLVNEGRVKVALPGQSI